MEIWGHLRYCPTEKAAPKQCPSLLGLTCTTEVDKIMLFYEVHTDPGLEMTTGILKAEFLQSDLAA